MAKFAMLIAMILAMGGGLFATLRQPDGAPSQVPEPTEEQLGTLQQMVLGFFDWIASLDGPAVKQIIVDSAEQLENNPPPGILAPPPVPAEGPAAPPAEGGSESGGSAAGTISTAPEGQAPPTDWYRQ